MNGLRLSWGNGMKNTIDNDTLCLCDYNIKNITIKEEIIAIIKQYQKYFDRLVNDTELAMNIADKIFKHGMLIACVCQHEVLGFCAFYANDLNSRVSFITLIAVNDKYQNVGFGKKILKRVCDISKQVGMTKIRLEVNNQNINAIRFYQNNGFCFEKKCSDTSQLMIKDLM